MPPVLAWQIIVWPEEEPAEYNVLVDATIRRSDSGVGSGRFTSWIISGRTLMSHHITTQRAGKHLANGRTAQALFLTPDPLFLAGVSYGAPYSDGNDRTNAELDAARKTVTLRDISQDGNGDWVLNGSICPHCGQ